MESYFSEGPKKGSEGKGTPAITDEEDKEGKSLEFLGTSLFLSQTKRMKLWFRGKSGLQPPGKR